MNILFLLSCLILLVFFLKIIYRFNIEEKALAFIFLLSLIFIPILRKINDISLVTNTGQKLLVIGGMVCGGSVILIFLWLLFAEILKGNVRFKNRYFYEKILLFLFPLNIFTLLIGLVYSNNLHFLISDTYKLLIFPVTYFLTLKIINKENLKSWFKYVYGVFIILLLLYFSQQLFMIVGGNVQKIGGGSTRYLIPLLLFQIIYYKRKGFLPTVNKRILLFLLTIAFLNLAFSFSRTEWVSTFGGLIVLFFLVDKVKLVRLGKYVLCGILIAGIVYFILPAGLKNKINIPISRISNRVHMAKVELHNLGNLKTAQSSRIPDSFREKLAEGKDVIRHMHQKGSWLNYIIGFGNGAQYKAIYSKGKQMRKMGLKLEHNIHNLFIAQFLRRGIIGVFTLFILFISILVAFWKKWRYLPLTEEKVLIGVFIVASSILFIRQLSTGSMYQNITYAVYLGVNSFLLRSNQKRLFSP